LKCKYLKLKKHIAILSETWWGILVFGAGAVLTGGAMLWNPFIYWRYKRNFI